MRPIALLTAASLAATGVAAPASAEPMKFVYQGAGCDGRPKMAPFEKATGVRLDGVTEFLAQNSWTSMLSSANWALGCWQPQKGQLSVAVPLAVQGATLAEVAQGQHDDKFAKLGAMLVAKGRANAFVRLGWEFNGNWYPWAASKDPKSFVPAFRRAAQVLKRTPGQHFQIVWNVSIGTNGDTPLTQLWPGDDVVDLVGADVYNQSWYPQDKIDPEARWNHLVTGGFGLGMVRRIANDHGKRLVVPEWGTGTRQDGHGWGDDPQFIHNMAKWMRTNNVLFQGYWDFPASDYNARMTTGNRYPRTLAAYRQEFGRR